MLIEKKKKKKKKKNSQLESIVVKDNLGNVTFYKDYNDYTTQLKNTKFNNNDPSILNPTRILCMESIGGVKIGINLLILENIIAIQRT